jgi:hypothetical protein
MAKEKALDKLQDKIKDEVLEATIGPMLEELCAALHPKKNCTPNFERIFFGLLNEIPNMRRNPY